MHRPLSTAPAAFTILVAGLSFVPSAAANEPTTPPPATASSQPSNGAGEQLSEHAHESARDVTSKDTTPAPAASPPQPDPPSPADGQGAEHAEGHDAGTGGQPVAQGDGAAAEEDHGGGADEHSEAVPADRPRALVLGSFGVFNAAVLLYAARLRRRKAPDQQRRRDARAAALTTDTGTAGKESR